MNPKDKALQGLALLKEAICDYLRENPDGVCHVDIVRALELQSDYEGKQKNYLSWSVLGILLAKRRIRYDTRGSHKVYFLLTEEKS